MPSCRATIRENPPAIIARQAYDKRTSTAAAGRHCYFGCGPTPPPQSRGHPSREGCIALDRPGRWVVRSAIIPSLEGWPKAGVGLPWAQPSTALTPTSSRTLSSIHHLTGTGSRFDVPPDFDPRAHLERAFGITGGPEPMRVRLLFAPNIATYIEERIWHSSQIMKRRKNGSLELRMETAGWKELVRWVLSWQPDVRVLAPKKLRDRVEEKMQAALDR